MRFSLLGSGSSGNAILIVSGQDKLLLDNGLSFKQLKLRTEAIGETLDGLVGVAVTHEHSDHVNGLGVLSRKMSVPIYITPPTYGRLSPNLGAMDPVIHFESGEEFRIGPFEISSYRVTHDAIDPVCFTVKANGYKLGLATDMGAVNGLVHHRLQQCHALILESNYCPEMIQNSPYPPQIVQRIKGTHGHLSNRDMNSLLSHLLHEHLEMVVAVHISQENNSEEIVERMTRKLLAKRKHHAQFMIASQDDPMPMLDLGQPNSSASSKPLQQTAF
jgi:phosphoribosyl 1,2-cyclic phosphodiesterase